RLRSVRDCLSDVRRRLLQSDDLACDGPVWSVLRAHQSCPEGVGGGYGGCAGPRPCFGFVFLGDQRRYARCQFDHRRIVEALRCRNAVLLLRRARCRFHGPAYAAGQAVAKLGETTLPDGCLVTSASVPAEYQYLSGHRSCAVEGDIMQVAGARGNGGLMPLV